MSLGDRNGFDGGPKRSAAIELRALLEKIGLELESQAKQFSFVTRLDFWIQFSIVSAVFIIIMTLLGNAWVGLFLVIIISAVISGLRWLQAKTLLDTIDKIREILK